MSRKRTPVRSTGPVKGVSASSSKNVKPAWTGMIKPLASDVKPSKSSFIYEDSESEEDEGDGLSSFHQRSPHQRANGKQHAGFSLRDTMNSMSTPQPHQRTVDDFFQSQNQNQIKQQLRQTSPLQTGSRPPLNNRPRKRRVNIGPFEPNLPPELEKLMVSGEYIDFSELVLLLGYKKTLEEAFNLLAKDILVWLDSFMYYTSVVGSVSPGRIAGLMRYSRIIMWIYKESQDVTSWWRYDKAYRRMAALKGTYNNMKFHISAILHEYT